MISQVKFVTIPTRDQDRALAFYTEKLGFEVVTDQPFDDTQRWIELRIGDAETRFVLFTPKGQEERVGGVFNGAFACDDVERTHAELAAKGVTFLKPPTTSEWGGFAIFEDSEGNQFVLSSR